MQYDRFSLCFIGAEREIGEIKSSNLGKCDLHNTGNVSKGLGHTLSTLSPFHVAITTCRVKVAPK